MGPQDSAAAAAATAMAAMAAGGIAPTDPRIQPFIRVRCFPLHVFLVASLFKHFTCSGSTGRVHGFAYSGSYFERHVKGNRARGG